MLAGSGSMWFVIWEQAGLQVIRHQLQEQKGPPRLGQSKTASTSALPFMPGKDQQPSGLSSADWSLVPDVLGNKMVFCESGSSAWPGFVFQFSGI